MGDQAMRGKYGALICAALFCLPQAALAEFLSFTFTDAPASFTKLPQRAGMTRFTALDAISLEGAAGPARLVVKFALPQGATPDTPLLDARVTYRPDGYVNYWQSIEITPEAFAFDMIDLSAPTPRVAGAFSVTLCQRASVMVPADPETCRIASGRFSTDLQID